MIDIGYQVFQTFHPNSSFPFTQCYYRQRSQLKLGSVENHKALFHLHLLALFRPFFKVFGTLSPSDLFDLTQLNCSLIVGPGTGWSTPRDLKIKFVLLYLLNMFNWKFPYLSSLPPERQFFLLWTLPGIKFLDYRGALELNQNLFDFS